jgi:hypothetical protein
MAHVRHGTDDAVGRLVVGVAKGARHVQAVAAAGADDALAAGHELPAVRLDARRFFWRVHLPASKLEIVGSESGTAELHCE